MRLYLLNLATMQPGNIPVPGYLIQDNNGTNILIDTGWPLSFIDSPQNPPGITVEMNEEDSILARLASIGLKPSDINYLVCSHLDDDHSGNHNLFGNAELIVQREHYDLAKSGHPRFAANRKAWDDPVLRYRVIDGDMELIPGVELLETSGHVPGHQSILVRLLNAGPILLAVDAVMHRSMADATTREIFITDEDDERRIRASTQKIVDVAKRAKAALVIYGHDDEQWASLKQAPAFYD
ncbi:MAG: N-acyl homoserine lactonase family protein [Hyphomicrobiales bacterium]